MAARVDAVAGGGEVEECDVPADGLFGVVEELLEEDVALFEGGVFGFETGGLGSVLGALGVGCVSESEHGGVLGAMPRGGDVSVVCSL